MFMILPVSRIIPLNDYISIYNTYVIIDEDKKWLLIETYVKNQFFQFLFT